MRLLFQKQQHQAEDERHIMGSTTSLSEAVSSSGTEGDGQVALKTMHDGHRSGNSTPLNASGTSNGRPGGAAGGGESHGESHEVRTNLNSLWARL